MSDSYHTIQSEVEVETKVKGSRFIGRTFLVSTVDEAKEKLEAVRKQEYQATHNCYAYIVGIETQEIEYKYSDDGEPGSTAGKPIYDMLCGHDVTNCLVVVTRYFGGTKLGTGGLVRAYSDSARQALSKSGRKEHFVTGTVRVKIDFSYYDAVLKIAHESGAVQSDAEFTDTVTMRLTVRESRIDRLIETIIEGTNGKAEIEKID